MRTSYAGVSQAEIDEVHKDFYCGPKLREAFRTFCKPNSKEKSKKSRKEIRSLSSGCIN